MKELFESLWEVAPRLMSVVVIVAAMYFVVYQVVSLQHKLEAMDKRLTNLEVRMDHVEEKLDLIIAYILTGDAGPLRRAQEQSSRK